LKNRHVFKLLIIERFPIGLRIVIGVRAQIKLCIAKMETGTLRDYIVFQKMGTLFVFAITLLVVIRC